MATLNKNYRPLCRREAKKRLENIATFSSFYNDLNKVFVKNSVYYKTFFSIMEDIVIPAKQREYAEKNLPVIIEKIPDLLMMDFNEETSLTESDVIYKHSEFYNAVINVLSLPLTIVNNFRGIFLEDFIHKVGPSLPRNQKEYYRYMSPVIQVGNALIKLKEKDNDVDVLFLNVDSHDTIVEIEAIECKSSINTFMYSVKNHLENNNRNSRRDYNKILYMQDILDYSAADSSECTIGFATYESEMNIKYIYDFKNEFTHSIFDFIRQKTIIIDRNHLLKLVI
ncbi:hypothetical protein [Exiguobacterium sp. K1]|uniref:hypothetical protein n=1 Tax=Exiguobacterium sp. K1 TaxID=2980105 RepID=UPI00299ECEB5|nr:hypothetical protein [Exiguobacterium sp. K1]MDX1260718.1 hypothetical protein [Exiguobacterium sp. K1]